MKINIIFSLALIFFLTVSLSCKTVHLYKDSSFLYLRDFTNCCHRHFNYFNNIKPRSIQHRRQKCCLTFEFILTAVNVSTQLEEDQALMPLFTLSKHWGSLNMGERCVPPNTQGWKHSVLPHFHTQWWFAVYLMVVFPRKSQVKESQSSATTAHKTQTPPCWKGQAWCLWQYLLLWIQKSLASPPAQVYMPHLRPEGELSPCLGRKWHAPISMAGRLGVTVQNHCKISVWPILQPSWQLRRRERIQEWAALQ